MDYLDLLEKLLLKGEYEKVLDMVTAARRRDGLQKTLELCTRREDVVGQLLHATFLVQENSFTGPRPLRSTNAQAAVRVLGSLANTGWDGDRFIPFKVAALWLSAGCRLIESRFGQAYEVLRAALYFFYDEKYGDRLYLPVAYDLACLEWMRGSPDAALDLFRRVATVDGDYDDVHVAIRRIEAGEPPPPHGPRRGPGGGRPPLDECANMMPIPQPWRRVSAVGT